MLFRIFAYVLRCAHDVKVRDNFQRSYGSLTVEEVENITKVLLKIVQISFFASE